MPVDNSVDNSVDKLWITQRPKRPFNALGRLGRRGQTSALNAPTPPPLFYRKGWGGGRGRCYAHEPTSKPVT